MSRLEFALLSTKEWIYTHSVGAFFSIPTNVFTDTEQRVEENKWQVDKDRQDNLKSVETILVSVLDCAIKKYYHTGAMPMGETGFGTLTGPQIILRMQHNYGNLGITKVKKALLWINDLMDRNTPIEVIL